VKPFISIPIDVADFPLIASADAGDPESQNDLAMLLLIHNSKEQAVYWFEKSAKQNYPDAMHWLGRVYIDGLGNEKNENLGLMWLAKAASHGHVISSAQMESIRNNISSPR
jgi:TPR repeat protein